MDAIGSVIFPEQHPIQQQAASRPSAAALTKTSMDHPLRIPEHLQSSRERNVLPPRREAPQLHAAGCAAGRLTSQSMPVRAVLSGDDAAAAAQSAAAPARRHEYQHPTYQIRRSGASEVKDLLYGGQQAAQQARAPSENAAAAPEGHPLGEVYTWLRGVITSTPRDADGNTDEKLLRAALQHVGLNLSIDGFAELLARSDVSEAGFCAFDEFVGCVTRPHRELPQGAGQVGEAEAEVALGSAGSEAQASGPPAEPQAAPQPALQAAPQDEHQTWRHIQISDDLENRRPPSKPAPAGTTAGMTGTGRFGVSAPKAPPSSFPLGKKSHVPTLGTNVASIYGKTHFGQTHKFSESFDQDHYY